MAGHTLETSFHQHCLSCECNSQPHEHSNCQLPNQTSSIPVSYSCAVTQVLPPGAEMHGPPIPPGHRRVGLGAHRLFNYLHTMFKV